MPHTGTIHTYDTPFYSKKLIRDLTVILNQSQFANDIKVADSSALKIV